MSNEETNPASCQTAVRRSIAQVLLDDYTNDQLRLVLKETSTRHTKDRIYSEEVVKLINHENIKDDDIYCYWFYAVLCPVFFVLIFR